MRRRQGFTLVELLVAMALILFIMAILSQAFVSATNTFRNLKAVGDMASKLRAVTQLLQRDLAADHFEGKKRLSNPYFWQNGPPQQGYFQVWQGSAPSNVVTVLPAPPNPCFIEGTDLDGVGSYRTVNHTLAFTIKVRGNQMGDFLSADVPTTLLAAFNQFGPYESRYQNPAGNTYNYQWAEVAWFLQQSINPSTGAPDTTAPDQLTGAPGVPLYTLYRRQLLAVPDNSLVVPTQTTATLPSAQAVELSCKGMPGSTNWYFSSPVDLTVPARRFRAIPGPGLAGNLMPTNFTTIAQDLTNLGAVNPGLTGADIQLTDVVSFDVRLMPMLPAGTVAPVDPFVTLFDPLFTGYANGNPSFGTARVFDTWSSLNDGLVNYSQWNTPATATSIPLWSPNPITYNLPYPSGTNQITLTGSGPIILAIQISIRIWDSKTNQTRQVTMVQAM
jgi:prepilin-type N-terminal cleavage/methylation domain-containing protein